VSLLCDLVDLPRSTFYYASQVLPDLALRAAMEAVALDFPRYGYRRMTVELGRRGWHLNHKKVLRLMRENNLLVEVRRLVRTTFSRHPFGRYPNLLNNTLIVRPDQAWVGDITYIRVQAEFLYLAVLMDRFTRAIRGWHLARHLTEDLTTVALQRALRTHRPEIHHSDQGVQYAASGYVALLEAAGAQISMAAQGQPTQNAHAERLMRTLKQEEVYLHDYLDFDDALTHIGRFLDEVYMTKRVHSALGYLTPVEFEAQFALAALAV
jgi:putative transposase